MAPNIRPSAAHSSHNQLVSTPPKHTHIYVGFSLAGCLVVMSRAATHDEDAAVPHSPPIWARRRLQTYTWYIFRSSKSNLIPGRSRMEPRCSTVQDTHRTYSAVLRNRMLAQAGLVCVLVRKRCVLLHTTVTSAQRLMVFLFFSAKHSLPFSVLVMLDMNGYPVPIRRGVRTTRIAGHRT